MIELKPKYVEDVRRVYNGDVIITAVFEKVPNETLDKLYPLKRQSVRNVVVQCLKPKKKRSLNANAYCWVLCDKIAEKISSSKEEVYRAAIRSVGVFSDVAVERDAVDSLIKGWEHNGQGWFAEYVDKIALKPTIRLYYGSSSYDTKQMARLIDELITFCKDFGIEHLSPDELEKMKQQWGVT